MNIVRKFDTDTLEIHLKDAENVAKNNEILQNGVLFLKNLVEKNYKTAEEIATSLILWWNLRKYLITRQINVRDFIERFRDIS